MEWNVISEFVPQAVLGILVIISLVKAAQKEKVEKVIAEKEKIVAEKEAIQKLNSEMTKEAELRLLLEKERDKLLIDNKALLEEVAKVHILEAQVAAMKKALTDCISADL